MSHFGLVDISSVVLSTDDISTCRIIISSVLSLRKCDGHFWVDRRDAIASKI